MTTPTQATPALLSDEQITQAIHDLEVLQCPLNVVATGSGQITEGFLVGVSTEALAVVLATAHAYQRLREAAADALEDVDYVLDQRPDAFLIRAAASLRAALLPATETTNE